MTGEERALERALEIERQVCERAARRVKRAREALTASKKGCSHPEEHHQEWSWEHDNGYGRQTMIEGLRCKLCGAIKHWKNMGTWSGGCHVDR